MPEQKILVTGAFGQIGSELVPALQQRYGRESVVALGHKHIPEGFNGLVERADVGDAVALGDVVRRHNIGVVYHLASLLSAAGERDPELAWKVNLQGLKLVLDLARERKLKIFWPSSIAAFGPTTPRDSTPQRTVLEPTTMYGVTKVAGELLCQYYALRYGLDVRSLRFPGIMSWKTEPSDGTTEYAIAMFYEGIRNGAYQCFLKPNTKLPMMYIDDVVRAVVMLMEAPLESLSVRTSYNLAAVSFSPQEIAQELAKHLPQLNVTYVPDFHQAIADSWPTSIDDSDARRDWGWQHQYGLPELVRAMFTHIKEKLSA